MAEDPLGQFGGFVNFAKNLIYYLNGWIRIPVQNASYKIATARTGAQPTMRTIEPEEAAALRYVSLKAHASKRPHGFSVRRLFAQLGWRRLKADIRRH